MPGAEAGVMAVGARPAVAVTALTTEVLEEGDGRDLEEVIFQVSEQTLRRAGRKASDIDGIVMFGNDQVNGRVISCMVGAGPAGGVDRDVTMIASSGEHAFIYAYLRLLAGQGKDVLLVGWGKPSECRDPAYADLMSAEPYILRQFGLNATISSALQASRHTDHPGDGHMAAWPLRACDLPAERDVVYGVALAVEGSFNEGTELGWVLGAGWATDVYDPGARAFDEQSALTAALDQLRAQGLPGPSDWDALELAAPSQPVADAIVRRIGLGAQTRVNAAGDVASFPASTSISGLGRFLKAIEALQDHPENSTSAAIGLHGIGGQGAAVAVFGRKEKADA